MNLLSRSLYLRHKFTGISGGYIYNSLVSDRKSASMMLADSSGIDLETPRIAQRDGMITP
jgi:hypothetical protein